MEIPAHSWSGFDLLPLELIAPILELAAAEESSGETRLPGHLLLSIIHIDTRLRSIALRQRPIWRSIAERVLRWQLVKGHRNPRQILKLCASQNPLALQGMILSATDAPCMRRTVELCGYVEDFGGTFTTLRLPKIASHAASSPCRCEPCRSKGYALQSSLLLLRNAAPTLKHLDLHLYQIRRDQHPREQLAEWAKLCRLAQPETVNLRLDWNSQLPLELRTICVNLVRKATHLYLHTGFGSEKHGWTGRLTVFVEAAKAAASSCKELTIYLAREEVPHVPFAQTRFPHLKKLCLKIADSHELEHGELARPNRGLMPKLAILEGPAPFLDNIYAPQVGTVCISILEETQFDCIVRSLVEWKSLRSLHLYSTGGESEIWPVLRLLAVLVDSGIQQQLCPALECLVCSHSDEVNPRGNTPLSSVFNAQGFVDDDGLTRLLGNATTYQNDGLRIISQWGPSKELEAAFKDFFKNRRPNLETMSI